MNPSYQTRLREGGAHSCAVWYSEVKVISRQRTQLNNDDHQQPKGHQMTDYKQELEELLNEWFDKYATKEPDTTYTLVLHEAYGWGDTAQPDLIEALTHLINKAEKEAYKKGFMEAHNTHMEITDKLDRIKELEEGRDG